MIFGEKYSVGTEKNFTCMDLFQYAETLLKEVRALENKSNENQYNWLKSKNPQLGVSGELEDLKPILKKMSPESCAAIAVKLDQLFETNGTSKTVITTFKKLLEDQYSIQMMEKNIKKMKEMKSNKRVKINKVHPELLPPGRQATVSFIVEVDLRNHNIGNRY